jgi:hypothetical protein
MLKIISVVSTLLLTTISFAQEDKLEVYMANQAGGYLALTHQECKVDKLKDTFPFHAYGVDDAGNTIGMACYQIPKLPNQEEMKEVPEGMSIIPVVNLIDLQDGEIHTLQASWFIATKPGHEDLL